jgi:hypothetical protein
VFDRKFSISTRSEPSPAPGEEHRLPVGRNREATVSSRERAQEAIAAGGKIQHEERCIALADAAHVIDPERAHGPATRAGASAPFAASGRPRPVELARCLCCSWWLGGRRDDGGPHLRHRCLRCRGRRWRACNVGGPGRGRCVCGSRRRPGAGARGTFRHRHHPAEEPHRTALVCPFGAAGQSPHRGLSSARGHPRRRPRGAARPRRASWRRGRPRHLRACRRCAPGRGG